MGRETGRHRGYFRHNIVAFLRQLILPTPDGGTVGLIKLLSRWNAVTLRRP